MYWLNISHSMLLAELSYFICFQMTIIAWNKNIPLLNNMRRRWKSNTKEQCEVSFEDSFSLLNNIVILTWWTQFNGLIVEEPMIIFFWNNFYFILVKELWYGKKKKRNIRDFLKKFFEYYFLDIIVNVNSFCDLIITVNTTLKY